MSHIEPDSAETQRLLTEASLGAPEARERLFERHGAAVRALVERRFDAKLHPRVDPSDIVQEAQLEAASRLDDYLDRRPFPFRLWLLKTAHERLLKIERKHLRTAKRSILREVPLPDASSLRLAGSLIANETSPSCRASRHENARRVRRALAKLPERDREIVMLRTFEGLSNDEAGCLLDLPPETAKKRYTRAILRLHRLLIEGGITES
jgi:RNA polymerase sigma-70 factor, ECF subfamily